MPRENDRQRGLDRLLTFSDAVVAIAITLVALPLMGRARDVARGSASTFLQDNTFPRPSICVSAAQGPYQVVDVKGLEPLTSRV